MERQPPTARLFDMIIASDGSGDYTTIQDAIDAAPANMVRPYLIFVKNGTYKGHVDIPETKTYLHFIGQNKDKVIITDDRLCGEHNGVPGVHVSVGAIVVCKAANTMFEDITFENSFCVIHNS